MFARDEDVVVLASPDLPGLVGRRGRIANVRPPVDGQWAVHGLRDQAVDHRLGFPTFTADQLRKA
jgi:hypothetical protein